MKRIKSINGYTIYQLTERDIKHGNYPNATAGNYNIYFSSDIRDYGVSYSEPEYDDIDGYDIALELCTDNIYALARELCENESTAVTNDDIESKQNELNSILESGYYDPEYDRIIVKHEVERQFNYFKNKYSTWVKSFDDFASDNFTKITPENIGYYCRYYQLEY